MQNTETVVLAAVRQDGSALVYVSEELKTCDTLVLAAVQQDGMALYYATQAQDIFSW